MSAGFLRIISVDPGGRGHHRRSNSTASDSETSGEQGVGDEPASWELIGVFLVSMILLIPEFLFRQSLHLDVLHQIKPNYMSKLYYHHKEIGGVVEKGTKFRTDELKDIDHTVVDLNGNPVMVLKSSRNLDGILEFDFRPATSDESGSQEPQNKTVGNTGFPSVYVG